MPKPTGKDIERAMDETIDHYLKLNGRKPDHFNLPHNLWLHYCAAKGMLVMQYRGVRFVPNWEGISKHV